MTRSSAILAAHELLTEALTGQIRAKEGLRGPDAAFAFVWLRTRALSVLAREDRPLETLETAVAAACRELGELLPASNYTTVRAFLKAELADNDDDLDKRAAVVLDRDPDGILRAMADIAASLFQHSDGDGARALVRSMYPGD